MFDPWAPITTSGNAQRRQAKERTYTNCSNFHCAEFCRIDFRISVDGCLACVLMLNDIECFIMCICIALTCCSNRKKQQRSSLKIHFMIFSTRWFLTRYSQRQRRYTLVWFLLSHFAGAVGFATVACVDAANMMSTKIHWKIKFKFLSLHLVCECAQFGCVFVCVLYTISMCISIWVSNCRVRIVIAVLADVVVVAVVGNLMTNSENILIF